MRVRKVLEQQGVDDGKDRGVCADRERKGENHGNGETRITHQHANAEANVLPEMIPPQPAAGFVETLLGLEPVAKGTARRSLRVFAAQPLFLQTLGLQLDVGFDLRSEVAVSSFAP